MNTLIFYVFFGVCFICFVIRSSYYVLANRGNELAESKRFITILFAVMFILWFAWFFMSFNDPYRMNLPFWARYTGLAVFIVGFLFFILSHTIFRSLSKGQETDKLVTTGIYSKIRNPMYLGFIIWIVGLPIFTNAGFTLASAIIWIPHILYWKSSEERQLAKKYEDYQEYKKRTWF
ncbi:methyltransferase family protein [Chloroflexota bacterium]